MADQAQGLRALAEYVRPLQARDAPCASDSPLQRRVFAFVGAREGVGATTIAANVAILLASAGRRALLLDGDASIANCHLLLGLRNRASLADVLRGVARPEAIVSRPSPGLTVAACMANRSCRSPLATSVGRRVLTRLAEDADLVLADGGNGADALTGVLARLLTDVVAVTTPEPEAVADTYACLKVAARLHPAAPLHVVVNMATSPREADAVADRLSSVTARFLHFRPNYLGNIPADPAIVRSLGARATYVRASAGADAARALARIASEIAKSAVPDVLASAGGRPRFAAMKAA